MCNYIEGMKIKYLTVSGTSNLDPAQPRQGSFGDDLRKGSLLVTLLPSKEQAIMYQEFPLMTPSSTTTTLERCSWCMQFFFHDFTINHHNNATNLCADCRSIPSIWYQGAFSNFAHRFVVTSRRNFRSVFFAVVTSKTDFSFV